MCCAGVSSSSGTTSPVTMARSGSSSKAVAIAVVQQLDGNVLQPVLVGRKLELHPVVVLLALTAGGVIAGLVGAFLAVPLAAVAGATIDFARSRA